LIIPLQHAFGVDRFKTEFQRRKEYYISGAGDDLSEAARERVKWLDEEYERIWSGPNKGIG
jgi:hypothetical protein